MHHRQRLVVAKKIQYGAGIASPFLWRISGTIAEDGHVWSLSLPWVPGILYAK